jgi:2-polyprenyl-3-methyl-5-hydroxy-6-metoxy-1,4-benzoquinol methylase
MDKKTIKEYIRAMEHITGFLRNLLDEELRAPEEPLDHYSSLVEFTDLRMLAKSELWPESVPYELICDDEKDKLERASGIIEHFLQEDLNNKTFLDYGCGQGHIAFMAAHQYKTKLAVGFDIIEQKTWTQFEPQENLVFTNHFDKITSYENFDYILLNDVLDHSTNPAKILEHAAKLKTPQTGKIFIRFHPFTSRHGTHLYRQLNKAYLQLVFTTEELQVFGIKEEEYTAFTPDPIETYKKLIKDAGLSIIAENVITQPVEMFFTHKPQILRRIKEKMKKNKNAPLVDGSEFPREILEIQFVDYILI